MYQTYGNIYNIYYLKRSPLQLIFVCLNLKSKVSPLESDCPSFLSPESSDSTPEEIYANILPGVGNQNDFSQDYGLIRVVVLLLRVNGIKHSTYLGQTRLWKNESH